MEKINHLNANNHPLDRIDGRLKVTGAAKYSAEYQVPNLSYGVLVSSTIARGKIIQIESRMAEKAPGVIGIVSHLNSPKVPGYQTGNNPAGGRTEGQALRVFNSETVYFSGQPVAIAIADSYERAVYAASLVKITYEEEKHNTDFKSRIDNATRPKNAQFGEYIRGEANAYLNAPIKIEQKYSMPVEVHNPMEMHSTIAIWEAEDRITVYDKTQGVKSTQKTIMDAFGLPEQNVQVNTFFVGGAFGSGLRTWPHVIATIIAARKVNRPVKLMLTREQMFTMVGYRPYAIQKIGLGATPDGKLTGITHETIEQTSSYEEFTERTVNVAKYLYASPNVNTSHKLVALDVSTPTWMRGPGETTGAYALESAIDELAYALQLDPIELRLRNYAETDPEKNLPWSSKYLRECYQVGAERFGWSKRNPKPATMREGGMQVGYGLGCGTFNASRNRAIVSAKLLADGMLILRSAVSDSGPGTATSMVQIASNATGISPAKIRFELGNSSFPTGPTQGGSTTTSTLGSAVHDACMALMQKLLELTHLNESSPFRNAKKSEIKYSESAIISASDPLRKILFTDILKQHGSQDLEVTEESKSGEERLKYSMYSFSAHFVEAHVNPSNGMIRIKKVVSVTDVGKVINEKTARSQVIGGVVGGIGMALMEEAVMDHRYGKYINNNMADYHVPVHADVPHIEAIFINKADPYVNPMGSRGLGEIALVGLAPAIANAVFHATGKRIRELPITPDKIINLD
ncbi:MAG: xanthine dehydrogenase family protein molybdopterin-binding subunit [Chitinophagaceae bacterium]